MYDAVIVGAGPAGNAAAFELARKGYEVVVLEDHEAAGTPMHCSGVVTDATISSLNVEPEVLSTIRGADVIFPNGKAVEIRTDRVLAKVIDRADLDMKMADAALNAGAEYKYGNKYETHTVKESQVVTECKGFLRSKAIIGADGASSQIALSLGENNKPVEYVRGIQADVNCKLEHDDVFRLYLGNNIAPGFFAWEIPCGDFVRMGLCTRWSAGPPTNYLMDYLLKKGYQSRVNALHVGKIPLGGRQITYGDRCLLAGDAAGLVKPISGGGLYPIMKANGILVSTLTAALDSNSLTSRDLVGYERGWKEEFGREFKKGYNLRKRFKRLSDADLNKAYEYCNREDVSVLLNNIDIDHPGDIVKSILRKPKAALAGLPLFLRTV